MSSDVLKVAFLTSGYRTRARRATSQDVGRVCDGAGSGVQHCARAPPPRDHYRQARRLALPSRRADLPHPRGVFFVARSRASHHQEPRCPPAPPRPAPRSATPSTSTTRRCATAPSGRGSATRSPTSSPSPATSTRWASATSRAAGRGRMPKDTEFFARAAAGELDAAARRARRVRRHPQGGDHRRARPAGPRPARLAGPGRHPRREVRPPPHRAGAAHRRRRELRDGRRHGGLPDAAKAGGSSSTPSTSSTASASTPTPRCGCSTRPSPRARTSPCSATPTAGCSRSGSPRP